MAKRDLIPEPHLLWSFMNRGVPWSVVIKELIDNSFDESGGAATIVQVDIRDGDVTVHDNGRGISDVNSLATLGDSGSFACDGNIGMYGIGAKVWLCKALKLSVETVRDGLFHRHTFDATPIKRAFTEKTEPHWLRAYEGNGRQTSRHTFTHIVLRDLRKDTGSAIINVPGLVTELRKTYWPALRSGKRIEVADNRKRVKTPGTQLVQELDPPSWSDKIAFESSINGKKYKASVGILNESVGVYTGLWFGFLFRNILIEKTLVNRAVPVRIHGQIELSADWRNSLSNYKDDIIEDKESLMLDIEEKCDAIFNLAEEYAEDLELEKISAEIEGNVSKALLKSIAAKRIKSNTGGLRGLGGGERSGTDPCKPKRDIKCNEEEGTQDSEQNVANSGIKVKWSHLGDRCMCEVQVIGRMIIITLNKDCPKLRAVRSQPRYPGLYLALGTALALKCPEWHVSQIEYLLSGMLGDAEGSESIPKMANSIWAWWGFVAEEVQKQSEVA